MTLPVKPINEIEEKSEVSVNDKILILDSESEEARLASKDELKGDKWDKWDTWDTWPQWPQGIQGIQWPKGDKWDTWAKGDKWDKGDTWNTWPKWDKWDKWDTWAKWDKGDTGATWPQWPTWPQWEQGEQWEQWDKGDKWDKWDKWDKGDTGNGIANVSSEKAWKVTTVTITETDGDDYSFDILDWQDGEWAWDVVWPNSSTNWNVVLFDWNTWKQIKDSWKALPTKTSDLNNDSGFITNAVNNLTNYYLKTELYNKSEVDTLLSNFWWFEVVATLPTTDIKSNVIYLLWPIGTWADKYEEWIYYSNTWTKIWETSVDLSPYLNLNTQTSDVITEWSTKLFLTVGERTKLSNTSWTNSWDETTASIKTKLWAATSNADWYLKSTDFATFNWKQDALSTQTAYSAKWTTTKVPQITTNTLWQVTTITEKNIAFPVTSVNWNTWAITWLQTTANLKTSLSDNSDSYYPSQKAVKTAVDNKQDKLVSWTNIKTINWNSILGSWNITVSSSTTTTCTLTSAWWSSNSQTVSVTGVTASNTVIVSPAPSDIADYADCGVYCSAQGSWTLTFGCDTAPSGDIVVNVLIMS